MIRSIVKRENDKDHILDQICAPLDRTNFQSIAKDLKDTFMDQAGLCVGLAAPQIGLLFKAIAIIDMDKKKRTPMIMINPSIINYSTEDILSIEGCMSMEKGKEWSVKRAKTIKVSYYDMNYKLRVKQFSGLQSRIIQHECDHLYGKCIDQIGQLYPEEKQNG